MITVEIGMSYLGQPNEIVEIYLDKTGLDELQKRLKLLTEGKTDHLDLMSESWGPGDLSQKLHGSENTLAHYLKITLTER
jgi:hypothetical protein